MDRKSLIGMGLIVLVIVFYPYYMKLVSPEETIVLPATVIDSTTIRKDTSLTVVKPAIQEASKLVISAVKKITVDSAKPAFVEKLITVKTKLYTAIFSSKGGGSIKSWTVSQFKDQDGKPVQFIHGEKNLNVSFNFRSRIVNLGEMNFDVSTADTLIDLTQGGQREIVYSYKLEDNRVVSQTLTLYDNKYDFGFDVQFQNFGDDIVNSEYQVEWLSGLKPTEKDLHGELAYVKSYALLGDENEEFDVSDKPSLETSFSGTTKWLASRTKYFVLYIIPQEKDGTGCKLSGSAHFENGAVSDKANLLQLSMKFEANKKDRFLFYIGPMEYDRLSGYNENLNVIMEWGWAVFRPLTKLILYTFNYLYAVIPNYGWVIIVFAFFVKIVTYPLNHKTYTGMQKMKEVMPKQKELQKKFKDNPAKLQQEMMKLYKEAGYNPLSGCLPMLIQMPLLFPIYQVFNQAIELRHAPWFGWIHDLSVPDTIMTLHTGLPLIGNFNVNPLPIIMTAFSFIQQKVAPMTPMGDDSDPAQRFNQKFMMYGMPIMFFFLFNNFSSGLVLYWTVFNLLSMGQQVMMQKFFPVTTKK